MASVPLQGYYQRYADKVRRYILLRVRDPALADDLLQECFTRLFSLLQHQQSVDTPLAFLYAVAHRLIIDHRRSHAIARTDVTDPADLHEHLDQAPGPEMRAQALSQLECLNRILKQLPLRTRQVFQLCRIDGMSYDEAAEHLNISASSIQKHLKMAMAFVSQKMGPRP